MLIIVNYFKLHLLPSFPKIMWGFPCQFSTIIHHWNHRGDGDSKFTFSPNHPAMSFLSQFIYPGCVYDFTSVCLCEPGPSIHVASLWVPAEARGTRCKWRDEHGGGQVKPATETRHPRRSSAKGAHLSNVAPPKPARDHISGRGPCRDPSSDTEPLAFTELANQDASLQSEVSSPEPALWLTH